MSGYSRPPRMWTGVEATSVDVWLPCVVVANNPVDDLGHSHVLGFGLCLNPLDKGFFDVQRPAFGGGGGFVRLGQLSLAELSGMIFARLAGESCLNGKPYGVRIPARSKSLCGTM